MLYFVFFPILHPWLHIHKTVLPAKHKYNCFENIIVCVYQAPNLFYLPATNYIRNINGLQVIYSIWSTKRKTFWITKLNLSCSMGYTTCSAVSSSTSQRKQMFWLISRSDLSKYTEWFLVLFKVNCFGSLWELSLSLISTYSESITAKTCLWQSREKSNAKQTENTLGFGFIHHVVHFMFHPFSERDMQILSCFRAGLLYHLNPFKAIKWDLIDYVS